jgi:hypothetical protein
MQPRLRALLLDDAEAGGGLMVALIHLAITGRVRRTSSRLPGCALDFRAGATSLVTAAVIAFLRLGRAKSGSSHR